MLQPAAGRADDEFQLSGPRLLGAQELVVVALAVGYGVAVNVQNVEERGILRAVFLDGGERLYAPE